MDQKRFENANRLWAEGHIEQAAGEFHTMAETADCPDEKIGAFLNEHKCLLQISHLDEANEVMRQIRALRIQDEFIRMLVDVADSFMTTQMGRLKDGVEKFEALLESNKEQLRSPENQGLYEEIQQKRGVSLTNLCRYGEAIPILEEAASFTTDKFEPQLVHFFLAVCYQGNSEPERAKQEFLRVISLGLNNDFEADAHYRLAILYYRSGALAQAKYHLEAALQMPEQALSDRLRKNIYQQMSYVCHFLKEFDEEKKYTKLAQAS